MSTTLTVGGLRQRMQMASGQGDVTGTFTAISAAMNVIDTNRFDSDGAWNGAYIQQTTGFSIGTGITRINQWWQDSGTFILYRPFTGTVHVNDSYELTKLLSFPELRAAINNGFNTVGPSLRTLVRDESQMLVAGTYQYTPNYASAGANQFFVQGVVQIDCQYYEGLPTAPWTPLTNWEYLDDYTIQLNQDDVDTFAGNKIRFTGYGPIGPPLTNDFPSTVIAVFPDDFAIDILTWACVHHLWLMVAAKQTVGERDSSDKNAEMAFKQYQLAVNKYARPTPFKRMVKVPTAPGWLG